MGGDSDAIGIMKFDFSKTNLNKNEYNKCMDDIIKLFIQNMEFEASKINGSNNTYEFFSRHEASLLYALETISNTIKNETSKYCGLKIKFIYNDFDVFEFLIEKIVDELRIGIDKITIEELDSGTSYDITAENAEALGYDPFLYNLEDC